MQQFLCEHQEFYSDMCTRKWISLRRRQIGENPDRPKKARPQGHSTHCMYYISCRYLLYMIAIHGCIYSDIGLIYLESHAPSIPTVSVIEAKLDRYIIYKPALLVLQLPRLRHFTQIFSFVDVLGSAITEDQASSGQGPVQVGIHQVDLLNYNCWFW